jgi:hypothetical protein
MDTSPGTKKSLAISHAQLEANAINEAIQQAMLDLGDPPVLL